MDLSFLADVLVWVVLWVLVLVGFRVFGCLRVLSVVWFVLVFGVVGGFGSFRRSWFSVCGVRDGWLVLNCLVSGV